MEIPSPDSKPEARKIGGWLILVAIGIVLSPLRICFFLGTSFSPIFSDGTWEALTTVGSEFYDPLWAPLLIGELLINIALFLVSVYLAYLFFTKKKEFPKWYASLMIFSLVFILVDSFLVTLILPEISVLDPETVTALIPPIIGTLIWTPYLYFSQRSKETFVV